MQIIEELDYRKEEQHNAIEKNFINSINTFIWLKVIWNYYERKT